MHLDLFNLVDFELVNGNSFPIITGAEAENTHPNIKSSISAISAAFVLGEYIDRLTLEYFKDEELWQFLVKALSDLDSDNSDLPKFVKTSQKRLLEILGYHSDSETPQSDSGLHLVLENIAGQRLRAISFFYRAGAMLK